MCVLEYLEMQLFLLRELTNQTRGDFQVGFGQYHREFRNEFNELFVIVRHYSAGQVKDLHECGLVEFRGNEGEQLVEATIQIEEVVEVGLEEL